MGRSRAAAADAKVLGRAAAARAIQLGHEQGLDAAARKEDLEG
jgi:hypothetical protein